MGTLGKHNSKETYFVDININDILAEDWVVIDENPGKSFPEVFEAFKEGKKIIRKQWRVDSIDKSSDLPLYADDILATDWEIVE